MACNYAKCVASPADVINVVVMLNTVISAHRFPLFGYIGSVPAGYCTLQCQCLRSHKPKLIATRSLSQLCLTVTDPKGTLILVRCLSGNYPARVVFHLRVSVDISIVRWSKWVLTDTPELWGLRFSRLWLWRLQFYGMWRRVFSKTF